MTTRLGAARSRAEPKHLPCLLAAKERLTEVDCVTMEDLKYMLKQTKKKENHIIAK